MAIIGRFKQEAIYGLSAETKKSGRFGEVAVIGDSAVPKAEALLGRVYSKNLCLRTTVRLKFPRGGGTPIHYLYGYVPPKGVVILKLLI